jgi:hypothetical protein
MPMASKPKRSAIRRHNPSPWSPNPCDAVPVVVSRCPDIIWRWRWWSHFGRRGRRRDGGRHRRARRRLLHGPGWRDRSWRRHARRSIIRSCLRWWSRITNRSTGDWPLLHATAYNHSGQGGHRRDMTNSHFHIRYLYPKSAKSSTTNRPQSTSSSVPNLNPNPLPTGLTRYDRV